LCFLLFPLLLDAEAPGKTLLVVAHPDDEYYFAATVYRMAIQLHGQVDELIITDGEGGFRYLTLAEPLYNKSLTVESVGRKELPAIRREEALNAGRILGIKRHFFLNQRDEHFTTDLDSAKRDWNSAFVVSSIVALIKREHYRYIFSILPRATTHGHHQAATYLAASAIQCLPEKSRPVLLGFDTDGTDFALNLHLQQDSQGWKPAYVYAFDRTTRFGFRDSLSYQIVVDWMIAAHKSQGLLQTMCGKDPKEYIWIDFASTPSARAAASSLFAQLGFGNVHQEGFQ
jgi:LmbE family N-acetylglucosaminyl deacetylase